MKSVFCRIGMIFGILGIVILASSGMDGIVSFRTPVDLYDDDTNFDELGRFDAIHTEFDVSLGCFVEEETTTTRNGSVTGRSSRFYYAIPVYSGEDTYWAAIKVNQTDFYTWEKITDETYDYLAGDDPYFGYTTDEKYGRIKKLGKEEYSYMTELFQEIGWFEDDSQIQKYVLPCYIDTFDPKVSRYMLSAGIAAVLIGIASLIFFFSDGKIFSSKKNKAQDQNKNTITIAGLSYPKSYFSLVDKFINQHENAFAMQELQQITGISSEEAKEIVDNWKNIY